MKVEPKPSGQGLTTEGERGAASRAAHRAPASDALGSTAAMRDAARAFAARGDAEAESGPASTSVAHDPPAPVTRYAIAGNVPLMLGIDGVTAVESWLATTLVPRPDDLWVESVAGGFSGSHVFTVRSGEKLLGTLKVFAEPDAAEHWLRGVELLRGVAELQPPETFGAFDAVLPGGTSRGVFMENIEIPTLASAVRALPPAGSGRRRALDELERGLRDAGKGFAALHRKLGRGDDVSRGACEAWCRSVGERIDSVASRWPEHAARFDELRAALEGRLFPAVRSSAIPACAVHGDATLRNVCARGDGKVRVLDVDGVARSHDQRDGWCNPANDLGRFVQHMQTLSNGKRQTSLAPHEHAALTEAFLEAYGNAAQLADPILLSRIEYQLAALRHSRNDHEVELALARLGELTEIVKNNG